MAFLGVAVVLHGALFAVDPGMRWASSSAPERVIPIEFVQAETSPFLAPIPPGDGRGSEMPDNGPGPVIIPKTSQPEPQAKPQLSVPRPAKPVQRKQAKPKPAAPSQAELDRRARVRAEKALAKAEAARVKAEAVRIKAEAARAKAEAARIARAEARQKRLELSRELAGLQNPDEAVTDGSAGPALAEAGSDRRSAASLEEGPSEASASDLRDSLNSQPMGGGVKRTEGSISWSIDGPIGTRRLLKRTLPVSPEWVSQRGLDLTVQVKFQVLEDGSVKQGAIIKVTSGFPELDRLANDAIKLWKFEAVPKQPSSAPQTWGVVTFRFTMG